MKNCRHEASSAVVVMLALSCIVVLYGCGDGGSVKTKIPRMADFGRILASARDRAKQRVAVAGAGDVNFGDGVTPYLNSNGVDYPWQDAAQVFSMADLSFVNLECCISSGGSPVASKEFTFRGPPDSAAGLKRAGVCVVSLANNHSKDYGTGAFLDTMANLKENGVAWCGAGRNADEAYSPTILESHGKKIAFVAFSSIVPDGWPATAGNPGCATTYDDERVARTIREAKSSADFVVASFHWGVELSTSPSGDQRRLAHLAVDSGADLVMGHHPHVVQGFELYRKGLIAYSLGNFIFSPPREISSRSVSVVALLGPKGLVQARVVPMVISGCRPVILNGGAADAWMSQVSSYCRELGTEMKVTGGRGFIAGGD